jgi:hypothetical protein
MTTTQATGTQGKRKRFSFYLSLSCLIHATLILLLAFLFARQLIREKPAPPPPEVTLVIHPPSPSDRPVVEAREVTEKPPENAPFQSDQNSKASSEQPPDGSLPLPSQQGVKLPALEFENRKHTTGEKPAVQAGNPSQPEPPAPPLPQQQPSEQKPSPAPSPTATPRQTPSPSPTPRSPTPPNNLKLLQPPDATSPSQPQKTASPATPSAPGNPGSTRGYQPESRQTAIHGNISNRGRSSVAAEATPIGRYKMAVADAIGSRW